MAKQIRVQSVLVTKDTTFDIRRYTGCMDLAFRNTGNSNVGIQPEGGTAIEVLEPGDPLLTWEGYEEYYRTDVLKITFVGGTGELKIFMTINNNFKNDC